MGAVKEEAICTGTHLLYDVAGGWLLLSTPWMKIEESYQNIIMPVYLLRKKYAMNSKKDLKKFFSLI